MSTADVVTVADQLSELVGLIPPEEPIALHVELRRRAGEHPADGKAVAVDAVADLLWSSWVEVLVARGVDRTGFRAIVEGGDHEVWLWLMSDRPYDQLVATIAGRVLRRSRAASSDA